MTSGIRIMIRGGTIRVMVIGALRLQREDEGSDEEVKEEEEEKEEEEKEDRT